VHKCGILSERYTQFNTNLRQVNFIGLSSINAENKLDSIKVCNYEVQDTTYEENSTVNICSSQKRKETQTCLYRKWRAKHLKKHTAKNVIVCDGLNMFQTV
jgi:hypothetical protein